MDYEWIFKKNKKNYLFLSSDIKLLRMNTIMLFDLFQHVTKNPNLNQNWYCKLRCHWQKLKHWNGWKESRFALSWIFQIKIFIIQLKLTTMNHFARKVFYLLCWYCKYRNKIRVELYPMSTLQTKSKTANLNLTSLCLGDQIVHCLYYITIKMIA